MKEYLKKAYNYVVAHPDKVLRVSVGYFIATIVTMIFSSFKAGVTITFAFALMKEVFDFRTKTGNASFLDLTLVSLGGIVGAGVVILLCAKF